MKGLLRLIAVIFALNAFVSADGETVRLFDPASIDHPVLHAGSPFSVTSHPDHDPSLGPLQHIMLQQKGGGHSGSSTSHFLSAFRFASGPGINSFAIAEIPWISRAAYPVPIGMKLIFPEHYFW